MVELLLASVDANGTDLRDSRNFSAVPDAAKLIKEAEQAFAAHKLDDAFELYQRALKIDPRSYSAALFSGDVFFVRDEFGKAIEWFSKAVGIDSNRELAFRYWGDALMKLGRTHEARQRYIEAVIAEPYNRLPREMLTRHATASKVSLRPPEVALPRLEVALKGEKISVDFDPSHGPLVLAYALGRSQWLKEEREKFFGKDTVPRHSLAEECHGLRTFLKVAAELAEKEPAAVKTFEATIAALKELDATGLLEAYVLFDRADMDLALDYAPYRIEHRETLIRYVNKIWFRNASGQEP